MLYNALCVLSGHTASGCSVNNVTLSWSRGDREAVRVGKVHLLLCKWRLICGVTLVSLWISRSLVTLPSVHHPCLNGLYWGRRVVYRIIFFRLFLLSITWHSLVKKSFSSPSCFLFYSSFIFLFIQGYTQLHKECNCPQLGQGGCSFKLILFTFWHGPIWALPFGRKTHQAHLVLSLLQTWHRPFPKEPWPPRGARYFEAHTWAGGCSLPSEVSVLPVLSAERNPPCFTHEFVWIVPFPISHDHFFFNLNFSYLYLFSHADNLGLSQRS